MACVAAMNQRQQPTSLNPCAASCCSPNRLAYGPQTGYAASKSIKFRLLAPKQGAQQQTQGSNSSSSSSCV
jgi:hypothetical protein